MIRPGICALLVAAFGCGKGRDQAADAGAIITARTLGLAYLDENRLQEASNEFGKLIRLAPDEPSGYANLGLVYLRLGRNADAQRSIDRAVTLAPDDPEIRLLQATAQRLSGKREEARRTLEAALQATPTHLKSLYALAELDTTARRRGYLAKLVEVTPANVPARFAYAEALFQAGDSVAAREQLELLRQRLPRLPRPADRAFASLVTHAQADAFARARAALETTPVYQAGLTELRGPVGAPPGYPVLTFPARLALQQQDPGAVAKAIRYTDATATAGLGDAQVLAAGDFDGDNDVDLLAIAGGALRLERNDLGRFTDASAGMTLPSARPSAAVAVGDYDNDGHLDVFIAPTLLRNRGDGTFARATTLGDSTAQAAAFADFDHDGDLDLYIDRVYRNNGDGTFTAQGEPRPARDLAFGDFDGDARLDLVTAQDHGATVFRGREGGTLEPVADAAITGRVTAVAAGDYDNDGGLDLFAGVFYRNDGSGKFLRDAGAGVVGGDAVRATFFDFDNDGWLDLVAAASGGLTLLHNDGRGHLVSWRGALPDQSAAGGVASVVPLDFDDDGDLDLLTLDAGRRAHLLRNDGGNVNQFVNVGLVALRDGSGKNNHFGIGSRMELRSGDLYQMRVVDQPVMHFGLGNRLKADVLRVVWTNGVPQSFYYPVDQAMLEEQILKGSCAFLYAWDGQRYRFVTDVLWGSALGMPLGIMTSGQMVYGPPQATQEYFRIPGAALQAAHGRYRMQITEELWEVPYLDQLALLTVDHPDSVEVYVDERFVPPGSPHAGELTIHEVRRMQLPVAATDEAGRDLLPLLRAQDDVYVGGFAPGRYQGIAQPHDLILDLGPFADSSAVRLFLEGWFFPTDASINYALSQSQAEQVRFPSVQVRDAAGRWRTVVDNLSFPAGKDKTVIVDLTGKFPGLDHHVRIHTNMEIYWNRAFFTLGGDESRAVVTRLEPVAADLHRRGFSRTFRKGGRYGPQWFDYEHVTEQSPWLPIPGRYTRYGDVLPLITAPDDRAVVFAPGDEITVEFAESTAPPLPAGWRRDFLLFNVNWMKDADMHTATGHSVEPLPFHAMTRYPYGADAERAGQRYPDDAAHRRYLERYNTRVVRP